MTDNIQRPLSADLASAAQKRVAAPYSTEHATGALVEPKEYEVQYKDADGDWVRFSRCGEIPFRQAIWEFTSTIHGWDHNNYEFRLAERTLGPWETAFTQEQVDNATTLVRGFPA